MLVAQISAVLCIEYVRLRLAVALLKNLKCLYCAININK